MNASLRRIHGNLGLILVLPLFTVSVTGIVLGIEQLTQHESYPYRSRSASTARLSAYHSKDKNLDFLKKISEMSNPNTIRQVHFSSEPDENFFVALDSGSRKFFDSISLQPLAQRPKESTSLLKLARTLHRGKFEGKRLNQMGRSVYSVCGFGFLLLALTGIRHSKKRKKTNLSRRWHKNWGWWAGIPAGLLWISGALWNFSSELRRVEPLTLSRNLSWGDWSLAFEQARELLPSEKPTDMYLSQGWILVLFQNLSRIYIDPLHAQGTRLYDTMAPQGWVDFLFFLHSGRILGRYGTLLPIFLGLSGVVLSGTGLILSRKAISQ